MNTRNMFFRVLAAFSTLLVAVLFLIACDSADSDSDTPIDLTGLWETDVYIDWAKTYVLPAGAHIDSVRYQHVGTHRVTLNLAQTGNEVNGTVDWNVDGIYVEIQYQDGSETLDFEDVNYTVTADVENGRMNGSTLTLDRSGSINLWLEPLDDVELMLNRSELTGEFMHRYLVTEWVVDGSPDRFTTELEFPVPVRLTQRSSPLTNGG